MNERVYIERIEVEPIDCLESLIVCAPIMPGIYTRLMVDEKFSMSNAGLLLTTNSEVVNRAHGDVLLVGLGLGMIIGPMLENPKVKSITVVEFDEEVISAVAPAYIHPKIKFVHCDIYKFSSSQEFDIIYFDIWSERTRENLLKMKELEDKFKQNLNLSNPKRWIGSFYKPEMTDIKRCALALQQELTRILQWCEENDSKVLG